MYDIHWQIPRREKEKAYTHRRWVRIRHTKTMSVDCLLLSSLVSSSCNEAFHCSLMVVCVCVCFSVACSNISLVFGCVVYTFLFFRDEYQSIIFDKFITMLLESERILIVHKYLRVRTRERERGRKTRIRTGVLLCVYVWALRRYLLVYLLFSLLLVLAFQYLLFVVTS